MTLRVVAHQIRRDRRSVQEEDESVDDEDANAVDIVGLVVVVADLLNHLFLLGIISRQTRNAEALTATIIGVLVIIWLTLSPNLPESMAGLRNPLHKSMVIVVGTLTIFLLGLLLTRFRQSRAVSVATKEELTQSVH